MKTYKEIVESNIPVNKTLSFIKKAHTGQKYGNDPYWTHPKAVADKGKEIFGSKFNNDAYTAALLHDTIEDTIYGEKELLETGYSERVLDAVLLVTKDKTLSYDGNIKKIIASGNRIAMMVKFADNYMNYTGDKSSWPEEKRLKSQAKYKKSMQDLSKALGLKIEIPEV